MKNVEIVEQNTPDLDIIRAFQQMALTVPAPETGAMVRSARRFTARARLEYLEAQNHALHEALIQVNESIQRGAVLIAKLHRSVPGAKEVIDAHLATFGIETKSNRAAKDFAPIDD